MDFMDNIFCVYIYIYIYTWLNTTVAAKVYCTLLLNCIKPEI